MGAIFSLESLAQESPLDLQRIAATLCAFVCAHGKDSPPANRATPVGAALQVLSGLNRTWDPSNDLNPMVMLSGAQLRGANLPNMRLRHARFTSANLSESSLWSADLHYAFLVDANLQRARLEKADLTNACLVRADLSGAVLSGADLCAANLAWANLSGADLNSPTYDEKTIFPDGFDRTKTPMIKVLTDSTQPDPPLNDKRA